MALSLKHPYPSKSDIIAFSWDVTLNKIKITIIIEKIMDEMALIIRIFRLILSGNQHMC